MLDIKFIRQNTEIVKKACKNKQVDLDIDQLLEIDKKRLETLRALEDMRSQKNKSSKIISESKDEKEKKKIILEMRELDTNSDRLSKDFGLLEKEFNGLMLKVPNIPLEDVPVGRGEKDNIVLREVGEKPEFDFNPRDYLEIAEKLDLIDIGRAAKVSGTRFGYLKGEAALLEFALINLTFDVLAKEGFIPIIPPVMLKSEVARGMG
jgi:seryl-tRNA synthetase